MRFSDVDESISGLIGINRILKTYQPGVARGWKRATLVAQREGPSSPAAMERGGIAAGCSALSGFAVYLS